MKFSDKIIQARKMKALTQEDLAEAVGVSRQAVSKWETGEAKPDLDKLVALCSVLDLSMDYLCLDKKTVAAEEPKPREPVKNNSIRYLILGVCIGLVAALLIGLLVMALGGGNGDPTQPQPPQTSTVSNVAETTVAPDYSNMLIDLKAADAKYENIGMRTWRISFVPSIQVPGMQVQIAVRNNVTGSTYYRDTNKSGASYAIETMMLEHAYDLDFIAVCTVGDVTVQIPLIHGESENGLSWRWKDLWKE